MPKKVVQIWHWNVATYNSQYVFSTLQVTEMGLFTGLGCSCFRQIYCSSLLEDLSNFPVEKSKEKKANLQGKRRLQWGLSMCQSCCFWRCFPGWIWWHWEDSGARVPMWGCGINWDAAGSKREKKNRIFLGALGLELLLGHSWARPAWFASCRGSQTNSCLFSWNRNTSHPLVTDGNPPIW